MNTKYGVIKKACNILGVASMLLGLVPTPVLAQVGAVYTADQAVDTELSATLPEFKILCGIVG